MGGGPSLQGQAEINDGGGVNPDPPILRVGEWVREGLLSPGCASEALCPPHPRCGCGTEGPSGSPASWPGSGGQRKCVRQPPGSVPAPAPQRLCLSRDRGVRWCPVPGAVAEGKEDPATSLCGLSLALVTSRPASSRVPPPGAVGHRPPPPQAKTEEKLVKRSGAEGGDTPGTSALLS